MTIGGVKYPKSLMGKERMYSRYQFELDLLILLTCLAPLSDVRRDFV